MTYPLNLDLRPDNDMDLCFSSVLRLDQTRVAQTSGLGISSFQHKGYLIGNHLGSMDHQKSISATICSALALRVGSELVIISYFSFLP